MIVDFSAVRCYAFYNMEQGRNCFLKQRLLYLHGKGGSAREAEHYAALLPDFDVVGLDYHAAAPWEAQTEFAPLFDQAARGGSALVLANSIGAYFALHALTEKPVDRLLLISPVVDMESLIVGLMAAANVTEDELREKGTIETAFGEPLSWAYLNWVRAHPVECRLPVDILYGENDALQPLDAVRRFARRCGASLTVMPGGEHWFHTGEQMQFLDNWLKGKINHES